MNGSSSNKTLALFFAVLMIVLIAEIIYLFLSPNQKSTNRIQTQTTDQSGTQQGLPDKPGVDPSNITYLQSLRPDNWKMVLNQTIEGTIYSFKSSGDDYSFELANDNNIVIETFKGRIVDNKLPRKVYLEKNGNLTVTDEKSIKELKNGVKIKITRYYDLSLPFNNNLLYNETIIYQ